MKWAVAMAKGDAPLLAVDTRRPAPRKVQQAAETLRRGGVVVYPTDTVYAIGASALDRRAVERVHRIKGIDESHRLACIFPDIATAARYAVISDMAYRWLRRILPGPYTVILEATRDVPRILREKRKTIGIRVPADEFLLAVARDLEAPIIGTSAANPEDGAALQDATDIRETLGAQIDLVIDGGLLGTIPSTVISLVGDEPELLREGKGAWPPF